MLVFLLRYGFFQKINDIGSMGVGLEDSVHPDLFELRNVIVRNDAPSEDQNILRLVFLKESYNSAKEGHMSTGQDGQAHGIHILL